jgi:hypothetical protein
VEGGLVRAVARLEVARGSAALGLLVLRHVCLSFSHENSTAHAEKHPWIRGAGRSRAGAIHVMVECASMDAHHRPLDSHFKQVKRPRAARVSEADFPSVPAAPERLPRGHTMAR